MPGRVFRLGRLLRVTRRQEDQCLAAVALARRAEAAARRELDDARQERSRLVTALRRSAAMPDPLTMTSGAATLQAAARQVEAARSRVEERERLAAERLVQLKEAARGRKSLEQLRERHLAEQEQERLRAQIREADEFAQRPGKEA